MEVIKVQDVNTTSSTSFMTLPGDILLKLFSFLPLRSVLQLEHLCRRLHHVVTSYLKTLKSLNLHHNSILYDMFRDRDLSVPIHHSYLSRLLSRCPLVKSIAYLSTFRGDDHEELKEILCNHKNLIEIECCDNWKLMTSLRDKLRIKVFDSAPSSSNYCHHQGTSRLVLKGKPLYEEDLALFTNYDEVILLDCQWMFGSTSDGVPIFSLKVPALPNLVRFEFTELHYRRPQPHTYLQLMKEVVGSPCLLSFNAGMSYFYSLAQLLPHWKANCLQHLQIRSTGSYSASLEHMIFAIDIAEICLKSSETLEYLNLPSSILVKQFFNHIISKGRTFPRLRKLDMTGLADTKMFLAPGNMVETLYYQEFIKLCPAITSLSLHSFSGSLPSLGLPLGITELTLPWDNRLSLSRQVEEILTTLNVMVNLRVLTIAGVEEVNTLLIEALNEDRRESPPELIVESSSLREVRIQNVCIGELNLKGCKYLSYFAIQCCPVLKKLHLPITSLEHIHAYDGLVPYISHLLSQLATSQQSITRPKSCHVHIQLHSVKAQEPDSMQRHCEMGITAYTDTVTFLRTASAELDFVILKADSKLCAFDHNSGEVMYPLTEFQPYVNSSWRSADEIQAAMKQKSFVMEGLERWRKLVLEITSMDGHSRQVEASEKREITTLKVQFCDSLYLLATNIPYLMELNEMSCLCQPSNTESCETGVVNLRVPRLDLLSQPLVISECVSRVRVEARRGNPLIVVSIMEYAHDIHTLFYYD